MVVPLHHASSILMGFSLRNQPSRGTPIDGNPPFLGSSLNPGPQQLHLLGTGAAGQALHESHHGLQALLAPASPNVFTS